MIQILSKSADKIRTSGLTFVWIVIGMMNFLPITAQQQTQQTHPTDSWPTIGPPKGALMIIGGSAVATTYSYFLNLVGDPEAPIVLIPTAGDIFDESNAAYIGLVKAGAKNIIILHTRNREEADSEKFVAPLRSAKAVFISGGFQNRLAAAYLNTLTHELMFDILDREGVIAGSSAGASIQGSFLYGGGEKQKVGFGFVKKSAIGQHYIRRNRMGSVARILEKHPDLFGFGVDEATAAIVSGDQLEVVGNGKVAIYDPSRPGWPEDQPQQYLFAGDKYNMASREITHLADPLPKDLWTGGGKTQWTDPSDDWKTTIPPQGRLLLYGSEKTDKASLEHFLKSIKNPKAPIVVLSTGDDDMRSENHQVVTELRELGAGEITFLHTINSNRANSQSFVTALSSAEVVWICDSRSWQLADSYLYTLIHKELFGVLQRNGVIGGNGAGAMMMASRLFGEPERYNWHTGFGLVKNTLLFKDHLSLKALNDVQEILKKDTKLKAIALNSDSRLAIEADRLSVESTGTIRIYKNTQQKPVVLSPGESYDVGEQ